MSARCQPPQLPDFMRNTNKPCGQSHPPVWTVWDGNEAPRVLMPKAEPEMPQQLPRRRTGSIMSAVANTGLCAAAVFAIVRMSEVPATREAAALPPELQRIVLECTETAEKMEKTYQIPASVLLTDAVLCGLNGTYANDYFCQGKGYKTQWASFNAHCKKLAARIGTPCHDVEEFIEEAKKHGLFAADGEKRLRATLPMVERAVEQQQSKQQSQQ